MLSDIDHAIHSGHVLSHLYHPLSSQLIVCKSQDPQDQYRARQGTEGHGSNAQQTVHTREGVRTDLENEFWVQIAPGWGTAENHRVQVKLSDTQKRDRDGDIP